MEFKVGQKVYSPVDGEGEVREIKSEENNLLPVIVKFKAGWSRELTKDGKTSSDSPLPFIYPHQIEIIEPKWKPKEGEWCWFWETYSKDAALLARFERMIECKYSAKNISSYENCAPFVGELPEYLKNV